MSLEQALLAFQSEHSFTSKGPLCVALVVTEYAHKHGLPLHSENLVTQSGSGGQVKGLGKGAVQRILQRHGIARVLASEGGRTSRGSLSNMREYVAFLNSLSNPDLERVEQFWIGAVRGYFAAKPFRLKRDPAQSLRTLVRDTLSQAELRQRESEGTMYVGAVLQHLVGAKLDCALGKSPLLHYSFTTADAPSGRAGDFLLHDVAIHVTTSPGEAVIERCKQNLEHGLRPILVTLKRGVPVAEGLAENIGVSNRIDIFEAEQFIALNLYELGSFSSKGRDEAVSQLVHHYNQIVAAHETDPSLRIEVE